MATYLINGLDHHLPSGVTYILKEVSHKAHLSAIANRLKDDVGFLVDSLEERNKTEPHIGFFPLVRVVMPIIEAVANADGISPQTLLEKLGIGAPYLTWSIYRDGFIHNDEFIIASYVNSTETLGIQSGIVFTDDSDDQSTADMLAKDSRMFDPLRIRRRLIVYLDEKIKTLSDDETVEIIDQIRFKPLTSTTSNEVKEIIKDIKAIHNIT